MLRGRPSLAREGESPALRLPGNVWNVYLKFASILTY